MLATVYLPRANALSAIASVATGAVSALGWAFARFQPKRFRRIIGSGAGWGDTVAMVILLGIATLGSVYVIAVTPQQPTEIRMPSPGVGGQSLPVPLRCARNQTRSSA